MRLLVITNDFPPRVGGINDFVGQIVRRLRTEEVTVFASSYPGAREFDASYPHQVERWPSKMMLPTPGVSRRIHEIVRTERPDLVLFGAAVPLGIMGPGILRRRGVPYAAFSFGVEVGLARFPLGRSVLRRIAVNATFLTAVSAWALAIIRRAVGPRPPIEVLFSGIDAPAFRPELDAEFLRARHALGDGPIIGCVSRLVPRKGQDQVIRALPRVAREFPHVRFLVVGKGHDERRLRALAESHRVAERVVFAGEVPYEELPYYFRVGDVFAMPCRSRYLGLDVEGLGAVYLQAAAVGRPAIAGMSGGAPEAVRENETGLVVDGTQASAVGDAILTLLRDPARAAEMGRAGASWVHRECSWDAITERLRSLLDASLPRDARPRSPARSTV